MQISLQPCALRKGLKRSLLFVLVGVLLTGCFGGPNFSEVHSSEQGYLLEEVLPHDTWFAFSISTLDDVQHAALDSFVAHFTDNPNEFRDEVLSGIDENLASIDLSYMEDIAPIIGSNGMRFMLALSAGDNDAPVTHAAITLQDPEKAENLFEVLEAEGRFVRKVVKNYDLYFNVYAEDQGQDVFYFAVYDDLFLICNDSDELAEMIDLAKSQGDYTLWSKDIYQAITRELPVEHVGMVFMDGSYIAEKQGSDLSGMALSNDMIPYLAGQGMAFVATEEGLEIKGIALGDRDKIDTADVSLDELQAKKRYLVEDMPGANLGVYLESYNLARSINKQLGDEEGAMLSAYMALFGLDPNMDIEAFLSEGYSLALHENSGFLPGLTLMVDVSGDIEAAQELVSNIDAQISGLLGVFQLQGGTIADAVTKEEVEVRGVNFDKINLDLDSLMGIYDSSGAFNLPEELEGQSASLVYGVTKDHHLVISTFEGWMDEFRLMLSDTENYQDTLDYLKGTKEGIIYVDFAELSEFVSAFSTFREALRRDVELLTEEEMAAEEVVLEEGMDSEEVTAEPVEVVEEFDFEKYMEPLKSFGFSSNASKYEVKLGGVILLDKE